LPLKPSIYFLPRVPFRCSTNTVTFGALTTILDCWNDA
jgi:hypothetical protein